MNLICNKRNGSIILLAVFLLFTSSCVKKPHDSSISTPSLEKQILKTEPIDFVHLPSDYELSVRGLGSTFSLLNPVANDYRKRVYIGKLSAILNKNRNEFELNVVQNEKVQYYIDFFTGRGKSFFQIWLDRSGKYIPIFEDIMESRRIPKEIAYLSMIESGFNLKARSHKHAVGPWQFIRSTGLRYDLKINSWVDERMHLEKSTHAAASYLTDLYDIFQSWELALASYNCGEKRVYREMRRHNSSDFWVISETLPRETRNYIPKYFAALLIAKNPEKYGFKSPEFIREKDYDLVSVPPAKSLKEIARLSAIDHDHLYDYNPSLIGRATPPGSYYQLKIPSSHAEIVKSKNKEIAALDVVKTPYSSTSGVSYYSVRRGDNLGSIARRFGTSVSSIKNLNGLNGHTIYPGQKLRVSGYAKRSVGKSFNHTVKSGESLYVIARRYGTSVGSIKNANNLNSSTIIAGQEITIPGSSRVSYRIKNGDTLSEIAATYRVSVSDLKKWNNISSNRITAGKNLVIYR